MIGPTTRDMFIWNENSEIAPGRSSLGTSDGEIALIPGPPIALATPIANTQPKTAHFDGASVSVMPASTNAPTSCTDWTATR
jgi:hypothetical protein